MSQNIAQSTAPATDDGAAGFEIESTNNVGATFPAGGAAVTIIFLRVHY